MALPVYNSRLTALLFLGFLSASVCGTAYAVSGEPLPFDQFTVTTGEITADCGNWTNAGGAALTVTCAAPTISDGMLQRQVTVSSTDPDYNGTYVQFIMTESGASGDASAEAFSTARGSLYFTGEDFIKMNKLFWTANLKMPHLLKTGLSSTLYTRLAGHRVLVCSTRGLI